MKCVHGRQVNNGSGNDLVADMRQDITWPNRMKQFTDVDVRDYTRPQCKQAENNIPVNKPVLMVDIYITGHVL